MLRQQAVDCENDLDDFRLYEGKHISMGSIVLSRAEHEMLSMMVTEVRDNVNFEMLVTD